VVGIQVEDAAMYTGTVIQDLTTLVERARLRAELRAEQQRIAEQQELHEIFTMQIPIVNSDKVYMGAA
jgi:hypothetical protein